MILKCGGLMVATQATAVQASEAIRTAPLPWLQPPPFTWWSEATLFILVLRDYSLVVTTAVAAAMQTQLDALAEDFKPLSDWRGSAEYRLKSAQGLLLRFFHENSDEAVATRVAGLTGVAHG